MPHFVNGACNTNESYHTHDEACLTYEWVMSHDDTRVSQVTRMNASCQKKKRASAYTVCCIELQCVALRCSVWQCVVECCSVFQWGAMFCSVL